MYKKVFNSTRIGVIVNDYTIVDTWMHWERSKEEITLVRSEMLQVLTSLRKSRDKLASEIKSKKEEVDRLVQLKVVKSFLAVINK